MPQNALQKLIFKPGVDRSKTQYAGEGGWYETNKVRFHFGFPEKMGGWDLYSHNQVFGVPKLMKHWKTLDNSLILAIATTHKLYVEFGGTLIDITPIRKTSTNLSNPIATSTGSNVITITDNTHGATDGAFVTISGATGVGGIPANEINAEHQITFISDNSYTITVATNATSTVAAGGGTAVDIEYQINPGFKDSFYTYGFGVSYYSAGTFGTPRNSSNTTLQSGMWSFALWGEDLLACPYGGAIYRWDATSPYQRATILTNAPTKNYHILVTRNRYLVCFGCNYAGAPSSALDPLRIQWCDQEDYDTWQPLVTNTAGDFLLAGGVSIDAVAESADGYLIWTKNTLYHMASIGPPYVFSFRPTASITGIASPLAHASVNNTTYWMSSSGFYTYSGGVVTMACPLDTFVFDAFDPLQSNKTFTAYNSEFDELMWFYPTIETEPTKLNGVLTAEQLDTIYVEDTAGFACEGYIRIGDEYITYTGKRDCAFTGCTRGADDTTIAAHPDEATVISLSEVCSREPDHYITYSLTENVWWTGRLERTAWIDQGVYSLPIATGTNGTLYQHEYEYDAAGDPLPARIESNDFDLGEGDRFLFVRRMIPDFQIDSGTVDVKLFVRQYSQTQQYKEVLGTVSASTAKIDTRVRGRQASLVVRSRNTQDRWRYGALRLDLQPDGRR